MREKSNYFILIFYFMIIMLFSGAVYFHNQVGQAVLEAGQRCVTVILPSLYFFSILTAFSVKSGLLEYLTFPVRKLFKINAELWMIVIFSQIGGYPVGAQLLHSMYQEGKISETQERNLICACMGSGFGFLFAIVGENTKMVVILWMILSIPNFLLAGWLISSEKIESVEKPVLFQKNFSALITESVENSASAMLKICGMITAFSAVMGILKGIFGEMHPILKSLLEISNLSGYMHQGGKLPIAVGLLAFGGICVHLQLASVCENHLNWGKFLFCRILTAGMSILLSIFLMKFFIPESIAVFLQETEIVYYSTPSAVPAFCLLIMSIFLLKKYDFFDKILTNPKK